MPPTAAMSPTRTRRSSSARVVVAQDGRILLCRRAIEPRKGFWRLPAGYMGTARDLRGRRLARGVGGRPCARIEIEGCWQSTESRGSARVQLIFRAAPRQLIRRNLLRSGQAQKSADPTMVVYLFSPEIPPIPPLGRTDHRVPQSVSHWRQRQQILKAITRRRPLGTTGGRPPDAVHRAVRPRPEGGFACLGTRPKSTPPSGAA